MLKNHIQKRKYLSIGDRRIYVYSICGELIKTFPNTTAFADSAFFEKWFVGYSGSSIPLSDRRNQQCIAGKLFVTYDKNFEVRYNVNNHNPLGFNRNLGQVVFESTAAEFTVDVDRWSPYEGRYGHQFWRVPLEAKCPFKYQVGADMATLNELFLDCYSDLREFPSTQSREVTGPANTKFNTKELFSDSVKEFVEANQIEAKKRFPSIKSIRHEAYNFIKWYDYEIIMRLIEKADYWSILELIYNPFGSDVALCAWARINGDERVWIGRKCVNPYKWKPVKERKPRLKEQPTVDSQAQQPQIGHAPPSQSLAPNMPAPDEIKRLPKNGKFLDAMLASARRESYGLQKSLRQSFFRLAQQEGADFFGIQMAIRMNDEPNGDGKMYFQILKRWRPVRLANFSLDFLGNRDPIDTTGYEKLVLLYLMGSDFGIPSHYAIIAEKYNVKKWSQISVVLYMKAEHPEKVLVGVYIANEQGVPEMKERINLFG